MTPMALAGAHGPCGCCWGGGHICCEGPCEPLCTPLAECRPPGSVLRATQPLVRWRGLCCREVVLWPRRGSSPEEAEGSVLSRCACVHQHT